MKNNKTKAFRMIAIEAVTVFERDEILSGSIRRSFGFFLAGLLDGFVENGVQDSFCLVIDAADEPFFRKRFPQYKLLLVKWWVVDILRMLSGGKKRHIRQLFKHGIIKKLVDNNCSCIWFPQTLQGDNVIDCEIPKILTIHDLMTYYNDKAPDFKNKFKTMVDKVTEYVAISEYVKQDCVNELKLSPDRFTVIPNSITMNIEKEKKPEGLSDKYILDMNGYGKHKNPMTLLKAYNRLVDKCDYDLVFCGGWKHEDYFERLKEYAKENGLNDRVKFYLGVKEEERNYLLTHASLYVTPSKNEGFGRGPIEAAMCRVPVISSKCASLYEVTKGIVNYYEQADDDEELAEVIYKVLNNPPSKEELENIAVTFEQAYTDKDCSLMYWNVLKKYV